MEKLKISSNVLNKTLKLLDIKIKLIPKYDFAVLKDTVLTFIKQGVTKQSIMEKLKISLDITVSFPSFLTIQKSERLLYLQLWFTPKGI